MDHVEGEDKARELSTEKSNLSAFMASGEGRQPKGGIVLEAKSLIR
jgi:hypothetical protein